MNEHEVDNAVDAAFFLANEVINDYHSFPVVNRADFGRDLMYMRLNEKWYAFKAIQIRSPERISKLEELA